ncbi:class III signal peptide-containing protein [Methanosphaera sp.]
MNIIRDTSGQTSAELILLLAGVFIIVLLFMNIYQEYITSMGAEIKNNELNNLLDKIDDINNHIK